MATATAAGAAAGASSPPQGAAGASSPPPGATGAALVSDMRIRTLNPEVFALLMRAKAIYALCGGDSALAANAAQRGPQLSPFDARKTMIIARFGSIDELLATRDALGGAGARSRDAIRIKLALHNELAGVATDLQALVEDSKKEAGRGGRGGITPAEAAARSGVVQALTAEFNSLHTRATGRAPPEASRASANLSAAAALGGVAGVVTREALESGAFRGAGVTLGREEMTDEHRQQLAAIAGQHAQQDALLDEMDAALDTLRDTAQRIGDELQAQERMVSDLSVKTETTQAQMDSVNDRATAVAKKLNEKSGRICVYLILFALLGAIAVVIYNMAIKKGGKGA